MKAMLSGFTVQGTEEFIGSVPVVVKKAEEVLEKQPFKTLLRTVHLVGLLGVGVSYFSKNATHPFLKDNRFNVRGALVVWGSKKTIQELRRQSKEAE